MLKLVILSKFSHITIIIFTKILLIFLLNNKNNNIQVILPKCDSSFFPIRFCFPLVQYTLNNSENYFNKLGIFTENIDLME